LSAAIHYHPSMPHIESVSTESSPLGDQARELFRLYYEFLQSTQSCGSHLPKLDDEIAALPTAYTTQNGEVLLAFVKDIPAACIAYRAVVPGNQDDPQTCDIKRLFVHPSFRGHGLSRILVAEVLTRARARNYTRAILDTDTTTMPAAHALYLALGFREYRREDNLTYLELPLRRST
jgi:GNAT superfamily N-acetyltransferase